MNEQDTTQAKAMLDNFNTLPENIQVKILNGVKCLKFLQDLADIKDQSTPRLKAGACKEAYGRQSTAS